MTPDAKPLSARCIPVPILFLKKKTHAAPNAVPRNGITIICHISLSVLYSSPVVTDKSYRYAVFMTILLTPAILLISLR